MNCIAQLTKYNCVLGFEPNGNIQSSSAAQIVLRIAQHLPQQQLLEGFYLGLGTCQLACNEHRSSSSANNVLYGVGRRGGAAT